MPIDRRSFMLTATATAAALTLPRWAQARAVGADPILPWEDLGGVWATSGDVPGGNVIAIPGEARTAVIDSKFAAFGRAIFDDARSLGTGDVVLINTHHHADHTGGNLGFQDADAVYGHEAITPRVEAQIDRLRQQARAAPRQAAALRSDRLIELAGRAADRAAELDASDYAPGTTVADAGAEIDLGGVTAKLSHHGPGHTDNDLIIHVPERNLVHMGDLVFNGLHSFFDQSGGVDPRGWIKSCQAGLELCDADTTVIAGHGPRGGRAIIEAQIRYIENLFEAVEREMKAGTPKEELTQMRFDFFEGLGFERIAPTGIAAVYDVLEAEQ